MQNDFDVLVIGAGPNGLCCGSYLARAGAKVAVVEKNVESGGGLMTQELSGFKLNSHAIYMLLGDLMPPYHDLELKSRGVTFITPEVQAAFLYDDDSLILYADQEKSKESVARLSPNDADSFASLSQDFKKACDEFIIPATYYPPVDPLEQIELLDQSSDVGRWLNELAEMTPREVIGAYDFDDERIEGALLYLASMFGLDPDGGGMGFLTPIYVHRLMQSSIVKGGSHQLASSLRRTLESYGGEVITDANVAEITVESGRAVGLRLHDGRVFRSKAVVSTLNPEQNFKELIDGNALSSTIKEATDAWEWDETSLYVVNWGVVGEAPRYEGRPEDVDLALNVVMGISSPGDVIDHFDHAKSGQIPDGATGHASCPSLFDPLSSARHLGEYGNCEVLRWECMAPFDADWSNHKSSVARNAFSKWSEYAPNLRDANIRIELAWSPNDIWTHLPTMKHGGIKHGAYQSIQMGYNRPNSECSSYSTPIEGFYVAGASTHPGGMVILGPGYNAARVVAKDLGLDIWWELPEMVSRAIKAGYLPPDQD